jgi:DNA polymerase III delta prime subunit
VLLVEGVPGIGKSTLIDALTRRYVNEQPARKLRSLLHLTQAHTYGPLAVDEDRGTLTAAQNLAHLDRVASLLEWHVRALATELKPKFFAIIDTLHITHCHRPGVIAWRDVASCDQRLADLGVKLISLHAEPATIWERGVWPRREEPFVTGYAARKWGPSLESIHAYFVDEQAKMQASIAQSHLPRLRLTVDGALDDYVDTAYRYWLD